MEENKDLLTIILMTAFGAFAILASIFNWNFFFEHRKARLLMKLFGRTGTRIFYGIIGLFLFFVAYIMYT